MKQIIHYSLIAILFLCTYKTFGSSELEETDPTERKSLHCLIVDDTALNRRMLGLMIKNVTRDSGGVTLYYAKDEKKAAEILAERSSIHLVISDGQMTAGIGGTKLVSDIRHTFKGFIVAWSTDLTEQTGMLAAGANYALSKPASPDDIKRMLLTLHTPSV